MTREYDIFLDGQTVGKAILQNEGLYIHYSCECDLPNDEVYRIVAENEDDLINLGICVPSGNCWKSYGRFAAKQLKIDGLKLTVIPYKTQNEMFIPITTGMEFCCVDKLDFAQFAYRNGKPGVLIK